MRMRPVSPEVSRGRPCALAAHLRPSCALFLTLLGMAAGSRGPVVPSQPFTTVWNANTQWCLERHGVDVDVSVFDVVANPGQTFLGPDMTIFYSSQLGTYPYYTAAGEPVFGGLPQNASLDAHLARAYGFPGCYNYDFLNPNYTGECPPGVRAQNDQLGWLWAQSRALYPSIYLPVALAGTGKAQMYVRHRVREAFRVAGGAGDPSLPVLPYVQIFYDMTDRFLSLDELEHSLGESAAQGAAGVVLWVSWENTKTKESCQAIKEYVDTTLGPFVLNVTSAARLCSEALCSGHGRCARSPSHPEALLFLNPTSFAIELPPGGGPLTLRGALSPEDRERMAVEFKCHCYPGWRGAWCEQRGMW
ncbi:PREDICTED: hyaluronidase-1 [Myotis brandtii]|uniref:hyaluronidase-1 n=1 Tax=Myotis brandtii TaxID=109478 RepID=UPI0003BBF29C|nr:PREDICTED: hyaluronidase-1 [Myotis brandtii]